MFETEIVCLSNHVVDLFGRFRLRFFFRLKVHCFGSRVFVKDLLDSGFAESSD